MNEQDELITAADFAAIAKVDVRTVRRWADVGVGPAPLKPAGSRLVRYSRRDVDAWLRGELAATGGGR
jgi:phage terminase Nu1 subunit (DNA packaging protein)